jgi:hypothetical protein
MIFSHDPVRGGGNKNGPKPKRRRRRKTTTTTTTPTTPTTTNKSGKQKQGTLLTCGVPKQTPPAPESAKLKHLEASDLLGGHSQTLGSMDLLKGRENKWSLERGRGCALWWGRTKKELDFFFLDHPQRVFFSPQEFFSFFSIFFF